MQFDSFSFGSIQIDGVTYEHDVVIDRGKIRKRKKKPSQKFRHTSGHTPLSIEEEIPWKCDRLVIGTGTGALPALLFLYREVLGRPLRLEGQLPRARTPTRIPVVLTRSEVVRVLGLLEGGIGWWGPCCMEAGCACSSV